MGAPWYSHPIILLFITIVPGVFFQGVGGGGGRGWGSLTHKNRFFPPPGMWLPPGYTWVYFSAAALSYSGVTNNIYDLLHILY